MPVKTNNTIVLLNFNDVNNPYKDECGNIWTTRGNVHLEYDSIINKNVINFYRKTCDAIYTPINYIFGNNDITIDGTCFIDKDSENTTQALRIFEFATSNNSYRLQFMRAKGFKIYLEFYKEGSGSLFKLNPNNSFNETWFHFAVVYESSNKQITIFLNGQKASQGIYSKLNTFNFKYLSLGASQMLESRFLSGKLGYFRVEHGILFNTTFSSQSYIFTNNTVNNTSTVQNTNNNTITNTINNTNTIQNNSVNNNANNTTNNTTIQNNNVNNSTNNNVNNTSTIQQNNISNNILSIIQQNNTNRQIRNGMKNMAFIINPYIYNLNDYIR